MAPQISSPGREPGARSVAESRGRRFLWLAALVAAGVAFSLGLACAAPLAAFAAAGALTLPRRDALMLTAAVWLANQIVGFAFLAYPWTADTLAWGLVLGIVALIATAAGETIARCLDGSNAAVALVATFLGAFAVYEGGLFVVAAGWLGGTQDFALAIVARIFEINAGAFVGLLVLHRLGLSIGIAMRPQSRLFAAARHA